MALEGRPELPATTPDELWIQELTADNFLAVYDVVLNIRSELQFGNSVRIPALPSIVKFSQLMPADTPNLRDRYMELRWKATELVKAKGVILDTAFIDGSHRWESALELKVDANKFQSIATAMDEEYKRRTQPVSEVGPSDKKGKAIEDKVEASGLAMPPTVTVSWLLRNVPIQVWLYLAGVLLAAFIGGAKAGQTSFIREILGIPPVVVETQEKVQEQIGQLTRGHNNAVELITKGIEYQEELAATASNDSERKQHVDAASRLRQSLREENENFLKAVGELKSLATKN
jgi:hypothetical protein